MWNVKHKTNIKIQKPKSKKEKKTKYQNNISSEPAKLASGRIIE